MSQKKVDAYKKEKANRSKTIRKEKRILLVEKIAAIAVCAVVVCWVGFSVYSKATANKTVEVIDTQVNMDAIDDFIQGLSVD